MKVVLSFAAGLAVAWILDATAITWPSDYESQSAKALEYLSKRTIGGADDIVLHKGGYPVAIVFGFTSDYSVCMDFAEALGRQGGSYSCGLVGH